MVHAPSEVLFGYFFEDKKWDSNIQILYNRWSLLNEKYLVVAESEISIENFYGELETNNEELLNLCSQLKGEAVRIMKTYW